MWPTPGVMEHRVLACYDGVMRGPCKQGIDFRGSYPRVWSAVTDAGGPDTKAQNERSVRCVGEHRRESGQYARFLFGAERGALYDGGTTSTEEGSKTVSSVTPHRSVGCTRTHSLRRQREQRRSTPSRSMQPSTQLN